MSDNYSILDDSNILYIENSKIRLGVNINLGGAVTYLSEIGKENLINSYDWGRQIQMSFYSGPNPFEPDGKKPNEAWSFLGWNPIQSGDCYGNPSKIIDYKKSENEIYVKSIPMQWPLENEPGECTFETWYKLNNKTVEVKCRLNNLRSDKTQYQGRHQELPAVYTNAPWYKLVSYTGVSPFTNDDLNILVDKDDGKGWPWISYTASESWAALVDEGDYGLGVFNPNTSYFIGGFAGEKGVGKAMDPPTGYISPIQAEILDYNIVYDYNYTLIIGDINEIRQKAYDLSDQLLTSNYIFKNDRRHWHYIGITDKDYSVNGGLEFEFSDGNALASPFLFVKTAQTPYLYIDGIFTSNDKNDIKMTAEFDMYDGDKTQTKRVCKIPFEVKGDGVQRTYKISLSDSPDYKQAFTSFIISFENSKGHAGVKSIKLGF